MFRTAVKPRWLAALVVVLLAASGMARLGQWQWQRAQEQGRKQAARAANELPRVPLTELLAPRRSFTNAVADRQVSVTGQWDGDRQLLVAGRALAGRTGWWVLTPLRLSDGSAIAVVRGWVASVDDPACDSGTLPDGPIAVEGVLRPGEPPIDREPGAGTGLPPGQLDGVDLTQLVQRWPYPLFTGYLVLTGEVPASAAAPASVPPTAPGNRQLAWQNLSYALQWFVFAGFGLVMWWRLVRDDHLGRLRPAASGGPPSPPSPPPPVVPDQGVT